MAGEESKNSFPQTRWTMVLSARANDTMAMSGLCEQYWFPLYGFARHLGHSAEDAQDLTQDFFHHLLSNNILEHANPEGGKLRSFLLSSFRNHAINLWRGENRQKRGGGSRKISIDSGAAELRLEDALSSSASADLEFDRLWARELLERARKHVKQAYRDEGKQALFAAFGDQLTNHGQGRSYQELAEELGMSDAAARYAAYTLRGRFRAALEEEVRETVGDPEEAAAEFTYLQRIFQAQD